MDLRVILDHQDLQDIRVIEDIQVLEERKETLVHRVQ